MKLYEDFIAWVRLKGEGRFGEKLFDLIANADEVNAKLLGTIYPAHVRMFFWWANSENANYMTDEQIRLKAIELEKEGI